MKKRTHALTLSYFEISSYPCCGGFFCSNKIGSSTESPQKQTIYFFSLFRPLTPKYSSLSLSLSLSLFFIIASQKEARTQPRARKRRGRMKKRASRIYYSLCFFIARVLLVLHMPRYRMYFFYRKNKTTKASERRKERRGGEAKNFKSFPRREPTQARRGKNKKKKYRKKTFINFAPITGTLGRKRMKECTERESEENTSEWCAKFRFSSARC